MGTHKVLEMLYRRQDYLLVANAMYSHLLQTAALNMQQFLAVYAIVGECIQVEIHRIVQS